jgi:hypothetical protein
MATIVIDPTTGERVNRVQVDPITGEIDEQAWGDVESLQIAKEEAVLKYGMTHKKLLSEVEFWKSEEKRIAQTRKVMEWLD